MAGLLDEYLAEKEADNKVGTKTNHRTVSNDLCGFFGEAADPRTITPDDAKKFLGHLKERKLAAATVARRIRRVRSIFAYAAKKRLISSNPFGEIRSVSVLPAERKAYVSAADADKLIAAARTRRGARSWRWAGTPACGAHLRC